MTIAAPLPGFASAFTAQDLLTQIVRGVKEWAQLHETESTRREFIRAQERATVAEIRATRDVFIAYLDRSFDERRANFDRLFAALDRALTDDPSQVGPILTTVTTLAAKSPFADLSNIDLVKNRLQDPDHVWEV